MLMVKSDSINYAKLKVTQPELEIGWMHLKWFKCLTLGVKKKMKKRWSAPLRLTCHLWSKFQVWWRPEFQKKKKKKLSDVQYTKLYTSFSFFYVRLWQMKKSRKNWVSITTNTARVDKLALFCNNKVMC